MVLSYIILNPRYWNLLELGDAQLIQGLYWFTCYLFVDGIFYLIGFLQRPTFQEFTTVAHHCVGSYGIYLIATERKALGLGAYFALTEISTPLLNLSWVLYTNKVKGLFTAFIFGLFYSVFFMSRIATIPVIYLYIKDNIVIIRQLSMLHKIMVYGGSLVLVILNLTWFTMLSMKIWNMLHPKKKEI
jgi:hypothetical protein